MLKQVMHPTGNRLFGKAVVYENKLTGPDVVEETVLQT